jgi:hypothetical protein
MSYLQSSLNFSSFIRGEIGKFGVGQAAVDMAFQTSLRFPEIFILDRIYGEEPLYVYSIDVSGLLTPSEMGTDVIQKEYQLEKEELKNKLIEYNITLEDIDSIFAQIEQENRKIKIDALVHLLKEGGISVENMVLFLKNLGMEDQIIARIVE